jgi:hypothetical protein
MLRAGPGVSNSSLLLSAILLALFAPGSDALRSGALADLDGEATQPTTLDRRALVVFNLQEP